MSKGRFVTCQFCEKRATHIHQHLMDPPEISCDEHSCRYCRPLQGKERLAMTWRKSRR